MTIAIQGSNPALTALETLTNQAAGAPSGAPADGLAADLPSGGADSAATIIDLSGGASSQLGGASGGLSLAASASDAALSAGGLIEAALERMRQAAQSAADPSLSADQRQQLDATFQANLAQVSQAISSASVGGINLIDGSSAGQTTTSSLAGFDLSLGGPLIGVTADTHLGDAAGSAGVADQVGAAEGAVGQALDYLAAQGQAIQGHLSVLSQATSALSPSGSGQVGADLNGDGARLQALQIQQQLVSSGAAISNQAPQAILALFAS